MTNRGHLNRRGVEFEHSRTTVGDTITVATAPSTIELTHWALDLPTANPTVVPIVLPASGNQGLDVIGEAVLAGLGKRTDLQRRLRANHLTATAWLTHSGHTDAVIIDAQKLSAWLLPDIALWLQGCGLRLTMVFGTVEAEPVNTTSSINAFIDDLINDWGAHHISFDDLKQRFRESPEAPTTSACDPPRLPPLPRCDGIVFRETCRNQLSAQQFEVVDEQLRATVRQLRDDFAAAIADPDRHKGRQLARRLQPLLERCPDTESIVLTARAAQIAALHHNWLLKVDTVRLIAAAETRPRLGRSHERQTWERLDTYRYPDYGAATALYTADISSADLPNLTIDDIHVAEQTTVRERPIPEPGARFVRTLHTLRRLEGAHATATLFGTVQRDTLSTSQAYKLLDAPKADTRQAIIDTSFGRTKPPAETWLKAYGLEFHHLSKTP